MPRGVRTDRRTFTAYRKRTLPGADGGRTYEVAFSWVEGQPRIEVRFVGDEVGFDAPAVYDHEKGEVTIHDGQGFMREVNEYWDSLDAHDLVAHWENRRVQ